MLALSGSGIINLADFSSKDLVDASEEIGVPIQYSWYGFLGVIYFFFPLAVGILSIGWALEDAGLIHYNLPKSEENTLFEIEPIYIRYNSYVKGYAGLSSIIFYLSVVWFFFVISPESLILEGNFIMLISYPLFFLMGILPLFPAYKLYIKLNKDFLKKKIPECKCITEKEYES